MGRPWWGLSDHTGVVDRAGEKGAEKRCRTGRGGGNEGKIRWAYFHSILKKKEKSPPELVTEEKT